MTGNNQASTGEYAGPYPRPPETFTDREGREISIQQFGDGPRDQEFEALVEMYVQFDPADRAQGIPPTDEDRIRSWLESLLEADSINCLAWEGESVIGHATLVPGEQTTDSQAYELAIFVLQSHQRAGIGYMLIRCLLGAGDRAGIGKVWLTVEHWNTAAIELYKEVGFETTDTESFDREMALELN
ncbi:MAG: GNAT family N-acetyltransferase [Halobacteriales archaeon]|nr:GNAT family N-acetyltransferase [Halobacteriales archaeon]